MTMANADRSEEVSTNLCVSSTEKQITISPSTTLSSQHCHQSSTDSINVKPLEESPQFLSSVESSKIELDESTKTLTAKHLPLVNDSSDAESSILTCSELDPQTAAVEPKTHPISSPLKTTSDIDCSAHEQKQTMATSAIRPTSSVTISTSSANARAQAVNTVSELPMAHASYHELSLIGNGAYGTVYLGRDKTNEDRLVALKKIHITLTDEGVPVNALREIALLKQLEKFEHPNIVRLLDICHGRIERDSRLTLILVFEYVEQDLDNFMKKYPGQCLEPRVIKSLMHQVLCGVDFLHTNRIIHRDLKPQNLLVDRHHRVKIADFGLARIYDFHMTLTTMVVTLWYRAPEVLLSNSYATPVDLWSCGCIFAELYRKKPMFEGQTEGDQLQRIFDVIGKPLDSEWPKDVSLSLDNFRDHVGRRLDDLVPEITPDGVDLLRKLLKFVPGDRISASEALKHPYFRGMTTPVVTATTTRSSSSTQATTSSSSQGIHISTPQKRPRRSVSPLSDYRAAKRSPIEMLSSSGVSSLTSQDSSSSLNTTSSASTSSSNLSNFSDLSSSNTTRTRDDGNLSEDLDGPGCSNDENNPNAGNSSSLGASLSSNNNINIVNNANNSSSVLTIVTSLPGSKVNDKLDSCSGTDNLSSPTTTA